jgi:hypothetical protein
MVQGIFIRLIISVLLLQMIGIPSFSQNIKTDSLQVADTARVEKKGLNHSLYAGTGYGSNMIYMGSTFSRNRPFGYTALAYSINNEFVLSASAYHLSAIDPFLAFKNYSACYSHVFNSWLDISAGIYRYQADRALADTLFSSFNYGDAKVGIDWKLVYSEISYGSILTKTPQSYLQIKNSRYFQTPEFFNKKAFISFDPYLNFLFGTLLKTEELIGSTIITTTQQYNNPVVTASNKQTNSSSGSGYGSGFGSGQSSGNGPGSNAGSGSSSVTTTSVSTASVPVTSVSYRKSFDLIEIEFGLPVAFNLDFVTIEAEATYVIPAYSDKYLPAPGGFVFLLSGFFRIF